MDILTDGMFRCPTNAYARAAAAHGSDVYVYEFSRHFPGYMCGEEFGILGWGAGHGHDIGFFTQELPECNRPRRLERTLAVATRRATVVPSPAAELRTLLTH